MSGLYRLHLGDETALVMPPHYSSKKNKSAEGHRDIRAQSRNSATGLEYLSVVLLSTVERTKLPSVLSCRLAFSPYS
jgi:hypothetical protein